MRTQGNRGMHIQYISESCSLLRNFASIRLTDELHDFVHEERFTCISHKLTTSYCLLPSCFVCGPYFPFSTCESFVFISNNQLKIILENLSFAQRAPKWTWALNNLHTVHKSQYWTGLWNGQKDVYRKWLTNCVSEIHPFSRI